jgi:hypothetical protein
MTDVRIYQPAKNAMQSGRANTRKWLLEFEPAAAKEIDPLMGWTGSADTRSQVRMAFDSKEEAVAFAEKKGYFVRLHEPRTRRVRPKSYSDNFKYDRVE